MHIYIYIYIYKTEFYLKESWEQKHLLASHLIPFISLNQRTGKLGMLQFMGSQSVGHDLATEQQQDTNKQLIHGHFRLFMCIFYKITKLVNSSVNLPH